MRPHIMCRYFTRQTEILNQNLTSKRQKMMLAQAKSLRLTNPQSNLSNEDTDYADNTWRDKVAWGLTKMLRISFDVFSGYRKSKMNEKRYLRRFIFLETLAVVPGTVAALAKHFQMLRKVPQYRGYSINPLKSSKMTQQQPKTEEMSGSKQEERTHELK